MLLLLATSRLAQAEASNRPASEAGPQVTATTLTSPWPHDGSDLQPDPAVTWGNLPNGLRYAVLKHREPGGGGRVSLRLHVRVGSLMEEDHERGLAHFLEHMAFNGTKHFPPGQVVKYLQRQGMQFGADSNASTSFLGTVYELDLPGNSADRLGEALTLFRDYADGMLLLDGEIDRERGVILSEKLARDGLDVRLLTTAWGWMLPESPLGHRLPIGVEEVIARARREQFLAFYRKWYTPDRLTVVVVGPVEPPVVVAKLTEHFGSLKAPARSIPEPSPGKVSVGRGLQTKVHREKEAGRVTVWVKALRPLRRQTETAATRRVKLVRCLADGMLNTRLGKLTAGDRPPFLAAGVRNEDVFALGAVEADSLAVTATNEGWRRALAAGEQELRRACRHGFSREELHAVTARFLGAFEDAAREADTRNVTDLADEIVRGLSKGDVFTHPTADLTWLRAALADVTPAQCADALRRAWDTEDLWVFVAGGLPPEDDDQAVRDAFLESRRVDVRPRTEHKSGTWAYTHFGPAGRVTRREEVKDLGLTLVTFANNVRLNLKPTGLEKDTVHVTVSFGAGQLTVPADKPGLAHFAADTFLLGGLERHGLDDLSRLIAGKSVGVRFGVGEEFCTLTGATNRRDLGLQFQLLCAYLAAPGYREDRADNYRQMVDAMYRAAEHTPEGVIKLRLGDFLFAGDGRLAFPRPEELRARTMQEVREWLAEPLRSSWLEIGVVGDFDPQTVIDATAATFGALPARAAARPGYEPERRVTLAQPQEKLLTFRSTSPCSAVVVVWPTTDGRADESLGRRCEVLAAVLGDRVREKVREELGESYSPSVESVTSRTFTGKGMVLCELTCAARDAGRLGRVVRDLAADLAAGGATADEVERAVKPLAKQAAERRHQNGWWMGALTAEAQSDPGRLDRARDHDRDYEGVSLADVNRLAGTYLRPERAVIVRVVPDDASPGVVRQASAGTPAAGPP